MILKVKVTSRYQVAIPSAMREKLGIKSGDVLLLEVRDGSAVLMPEPGAYADHLREKYGSIWDGVEVEAYLREERGGCSGE